MRRSTLSVRQATIPKDMHVIAAERRLSIGLSSNGVEYRCISRFQPVFSRYVYRVKPVCDQHQLPNDAMGLAGYFALAFRELGGMENGPPSVIKKRKLRGGTPECRFWERGPRPESTTEPQRRTALLWRPPPWSSRGEVHTFPAPRLDLARRRSEEGRPPPHRPGHRPDGPVAADLLDRRRAVKFQNNETVGASLQFHCKNARFFPWCGCTFRRALCYINIYLTKRREYE